MHAIVSVRRPHPMTSGGSLYMATRVLVGGSTPYTRPATIERLQLVMLGKLEANLLGFSPL